MYEDHEFLAGLSPLREEERRYLEAVHNTRPMPTPTSPFAPILSTSENHVYSDPTLPAVNPEEIFTSEAGGKKTDSKERKCVAPSVKESKNESSVGLTADEEIDKFIRKQRSQQTVYKDRTETNRPKKFCESVGENRELENIPPVELNKILFSFFYDSKKEGW